MYELCVDELAPTMNTAYATGRFNNRRFLSKEGKDFKKLVELAVRTNPFVRTSGLYRLEIEFTCKEWMCKDGSVRRWDVSNRLKIAEDALCEAIGIDDSHVFEITIRKLVGPDRCTRYRLGVLE